MNGFGATPPTRFENISIVRAGGHFWGSQTFPGISGFGIWANELPEPGQGPAVGSATFNNLQLSNNAVNIRNTTSTFTITQNP